MCTFKNTRNGFQHHATMFTRGRQIGSARASYVNRTWEAYEYQSVIVEAIRTADPLSDKVRARLLADAQSKKFL